MLAPLESIAPEVIGLEHVTTPEPDVTLPTYGGSAIGDADSDHLFAGNDVDTPRPIASLTKVITALVVLDAQPIATDTDGAVITLTTTDTQLVARYAAINGSTAPAPTGRTITQREVIELMIVHSANNYAETLAVWAFGSVDAYLVAARNWLDAHNLGGVTIADSTGFSPDNTASPRMLLRLARIALSEPVVAGAAALPRVNVAGIGSFDNRNLLVGLDGVTGLKTGTLRESGSSLLFSAEHTGSTGEHRVVGVVLNGPDGPRVADDARALLLSVRDDYRELVLAEEATLVARYEAPWGDTAELRLTRGVDDVVWGAVSSRSVINAPVLQPGVESDDRAFAEIRFAGERVDVPLSWSGSINEPPLDWRIAQAAEQLAETLGLSN
jgi:D-alanyl-D-alanine carboxypeptidase (penicillin-binding protein 5/6)